MSHFVFFRALRREKMPSCITQLFAKKLFIIRQSSSPEIKFLKVFFLARGQKSVIKCHICTRFDVFLHSRMLCQVIKLFIWFCQLS